VKIDQLLVEGGNVGPTLRVVEEEIYGRSFGREREERLVNRWRFKKHSFKESTDATEVS
jgi:hypothetical protein